MRRKSIPVIVFTCLLLVGAGCIWFQHGKESVHENDCLSTLRPTGYALGLYCENHNGTLPENFSLMSNLVTTTRLYVCPWDSKAPGSWTNITDWMDYLYAPWPSVTGVYTNYPLMYDRRLSNHGGKGINILLVEGAVHPSSPRYPETFHGQFFWDEGAKWLQKFAKEHPDLKVPLPEDLK